MGKDKKNNSSSTFKAGAVSLAFLLIGYQSALFIHRASVLKIEADRDRPDTVYIHISDTDGGVGQGSVVSETRRESRHGKAANAVRRETRRIENFNFNPNTASIGDFLRLGFSEKQASAICRYRDKGGRFHRKEDFARSFVVADSVYARLEKFIVIPKIDINAADSAAFDALPGIGPYFARKMVEYRNKIGGYTCTEQLMDIRNFDREKYENLKDLVTCGDDARE